MWFSAVKAIVKEREMERVIKSGNSVATSKRELTQPSRRPAAGQLKDGSSWRRELQKNWQLYAMALPGILVLLIFGYGPMFGLSIAFVDYSPARGIMHSEWVGLEWFRRAFSNPMFWTAVRNTLTIKGLQTLIGFPSAIILALLLNEVRIRWFKKMVQTATFLPYFVSWVIISSMFRNILGSSGVVNQILVNVFALKPVNFLTDPAIFRWVVVLQDTWKWCGYFAVLYLAAMTTIDPALYEAAEIDGASRWQQTWHITIPSIKPMMSTILIILVGFLIDTGSGGGGTFEQIYTMYNVSVYATADIISTFTYRLGLGQSRYSLATAVGLFQSVIAFGLVACANRIMKRLGQEGLF